MNPGSRYQLRKLKLETRTQIKEKSGALKIKRDEEALKGESYLDGCYVIKTDMKESEANTCLVHGRYKDLTEVEKVFQGCKTVYPEVRPVHTRKEESTQWHVFVVMFACLVIRRLRYAWAGFNLIEEEGLKQLTTICSMDVIVKGRNAGCQ